MRRVIVLIAGVLVAGCGADGDSVGATGAPAADVAEAADSATADAGPADVDAPGGANAGPADVDAPDGADAGPADVDAPDGADAPDAACAPIAPIPRGSARLAVDPQTGRLRDALGRDVVMRGINAGGRSKWAPFLPFEMDPAAALPDVRAAADAFFARLPAWGLDTVRLTLSWEALEPVQGAIDGAYLDRYEALVDAAWGHGLRVIVDFHQDVFASPFCGDGFPPWAVVTPDPGPPRHDCPEWFQGYLTGADVKACFDALWDPASGLEDAMGGMWDTVAARLADHPGVVGFEILNEPGWGTAKDIDAWKRDVLTPFHARMAARLRDAAPEALVLYDSTGVDGVVNDQARFRPDGDGLIFAPHLYDFGLLSGGAPMGVPVPEQAIAAHAAWGAGAKTPILLGEFGTSGDPDALAQQWLDRTMGAIDEARISASLWELSQSGELWNGEDLSVLDASGAERPVLDVYVRPWLRAVAGTDAHFAWDRVAGTAEATWTATGGVTEIALPPRAFPQGPQALVVEGACHTVDLDRGELRVQAPPGTPVTVRFSR